MTKLITQLESIISKKMQLSDSQIKQLGQEIKTQEVEYLKNNIFSPEIKNVSVFINFYELCCYFYIINNELSSFENYFLRLRHFYINNNKKSDNYYILTSLYLIFLFSFNRNNEFNIIFESVKKDIGVNEHIEFVSKLSNLFKVGSYNKALELSKRPPNYMYNYITSRIIETIRVEIFKNMISSIEEIELSLLQNILQLSNSSDFNHFLNNINQFVTNRKYIWEINNGYLKVIKKSNNYELNPDLLLVNTIEQIKEFDKIF